MATHVSTPPHERPVVASAEVDTPGLQRWREALADPQLRDLPYKVETNARGQLVLSPHKVSHSLAQSRVLKLLEKHVAGTGEATIEFAAHTSDGVKVPDVVWMSAERWAQVPADAEASPVMPEICVEVLSASNTQAEMDEKSDLCFEGGAREVWIVNADGTVRFYGPDGETEQSALAPDFPNEVPV